MCKFRKMESEDIPVVIEMTKDFFEEANVPAIFPDGEEERNACIYSVLISPSSHTFVVEDEYGLMGFITYNVAPSVWKPTQLHADEVGLWVDPGSSNFAALKLLRKSREALKEMGVKTYTLCYIQSSPPYISNVYESLGTKLAQVTYMGEL